MRFTCGNIIGKNDAAEISGNLKFCWINKIRCNGSGTAQDRNLVRISFFQFRLHHTIHFRYGNQ